MKNFNETFWLFIFTVIFSTHILCQTPVHIIPTQFQLYQNIPEPFYTNEGTDIPFDIPRQAFVKIWIENSNNSLVATLVSMENPTAGKYMVHVNANTFSEGLYSCKMEVDSQGATIFRNSISMHCRIATSVLEGNRKTSLSEFQLHQNYPNPFNPTTNISFTIPLTAFVSLKIFDVMGRKVTTLVDEDKSPGNYTVEFDGSELASGIYFYKIQSGDFIETKKFVLLK